jgi:hypothetical protein
METPFEELEKFAVKLERTAGLFDASAPTMIQEIGFAPDSPLEEGGFELLVPLANKCRSGAIYHLSPLPSTVFAHSPGGGAAASADRMPTDGDRLL